MAIDWLLIGITNHGFIQWAFFGLTTCLIVAIPLQLREHRQLIRNYERQGNIPNVVSTRPQLHI